MKKKVMVALRTARPERYLRVNDCSKLTQTYAPLPNQNGPVLPLRESDPPKAEPDICQSSVHHRDEQRLCTIDHWRKS
jgi:hypothetical protein